MHSRKPVAPLRIRTPSASSTPSTTSIEIDEEEVKMAMMEYHPPSRPLTVSIPKSSSSQCQRRPNLSEILANTAPPPWTLSSFMAFLSQNHCLENLEFTMDASRYRKHFQKMVNRHPGTPISPLSDECAYVLMLWRRLIDAYIRESGPREVNLPADVRDTLLALSESYVPPHPSALDEAVSKIYELMEESVLVSFLNSASPQSAQRTPSHDGYDSSLSRSTTRSYDERTLHFTRSQPQPPPHQRASAPSSLTANFMHARPFAHARFNSQPATSSAVPMSRGALSYASGSDALTDDSGSGSPSGMSDPLTPPGTPPLSEYPMTDFHQAYYENGSNSGSGTPSPRLSRGEHTGLANATRDSWKRVSSKLWPKKRSGTHLRDDEQGVVEGGLF
ncbi:regulator of G protein signaling superfamily [Massarina eburnea CBS 473.64]|uniref:Regulator of G protein signaling superfamily n=1 Tax=Massarina eburnea CBS 473.64 TaxID=1395130 RepID=A0A6A6RIJ8_9PLEO|nr:regulator of G protein signaling superfamily [Massarina eburnea CBS 473.64]